MTTDTNNTNRLPLIEAMAEALYLYLDNDPGHTTYASAPWGHQHEYSVAAQAALTAANRAGFVLVERGLVEDARVAVLRYGSTPHLCPGCSCDNELDKDHREGCLVADLAARLRAAAGEKL